MWPSTCLTTGQDKRYPANHRGDNEVLQVLWGRADAGESEPATASGHVSRPWLTADGNGWLSQVLPQDETQAAQDGWCRKFFQYFIIFFSVEINFWSKWGSRNFNCKCKHTYLFLLTDPFCLLISYSFATR